MTNKTLKNRIEAIEKQVPEPTKNENDKTPRADDYKELLLNFARDYPQHHDYIVQRLDAVEREHGF